MLSDLSFKLYDQVKKQNTPRVLKHWHASSISECPRAHYFKRLGIPALPMNQPTGAKLLRWQAGHHLEAAVRPYIEILYPDVISNIRLTSDKWDLTGEYDNYSEESKALIEIKSVDDYAFTEKDGRTELRDGKPYLHHVLQNHAYALLLNEVGRPVDTIDFVYLALKGRVVTYSVPIEEEYQDHVRARLVALNEAWKAKVPPVCLCDPEARLWGGVYQWCDYRTKDGCCDLNLIKEVK